MTEIVLSPDQQQAYDDFSDWIALEREDRPRAWFSIHGAAGTGKTTIAKKLATVHDGPIYPMAYSGKAAEVLRRKGLYSAKTIHSSIYLPVNEINNEIAELNAELAAQPPPKPERVRKIRRRLEVLHAPTFAPRPNPFNPDGIIILDECSMCGEEEGTDLIATELPILVLGDPYQLPPIKGKGFFDKDPNFELTQIHRQAAESPIIKLATMAREGRRPPLGQYGDCLVTSRARVTVTDLCDADQVVCGSNKGRITLNQKMRRHLGYDGKFPKKGEKVICLRNNAKNQLLNGQIFELMEDAVKGPWGTLDFELSNGRQVQVWEECFTDPDVLKSWDYFKRKQAEEFDFAYALTAHKFQGSEADNVLVFADMWAWDTEKFSQWLYSATTRAAERVTIAL